MATLFTSRSLTLIFSYFEIQIRQISQKPQKQTSQHTNRSPL
ncbi:hypothetical protein SD15574_1954 [Shigella dysenteriae 155-74]|nr:hypothetical protein SD15574_1954 [Shigella dysenteriae 155-74]